MVRRATGNHRLLGDTVYRARTVLRFFWQILW
jgi:hypothetical protein